MGCNQVLGVIMITLSLGLLGICAGGYQANHLDIAPLYAGQSLTLPNIKQIDPNKYCISSKYGTGCQAHFLKVAIFRSIEIPNLTSIFSSIYRDKYYVNMISVI